MEQLIFELAEAEAASFANYLPGPNAEAVAALERLAEGASSEAAVLIWGAPAAGKTHLLEASIGAAIERGRHAVYLSEPGALLATDPEVLSANHFVAVDALDAASAEAQQRLFTLFNALRASGGGFLGASRIPPSALELREDLRTRLGWGLVYEIVALADADKPAALLAYARRRGFGLPDDVIRYLLSHGRRDMPTLLRTLTALDRHSLANKRPVTVALLRSWLQRELG